MAFPQKGAVKIRDFMFELNDEVRLPDQVINDAIIKFGANGISFRYEVKSVVENKMLSLLEIDERLHKPIFDFFQDLSAAPRTSSKKKGNSKSPKFDDSVWNVAVEEPDVEIGQGGDGVERGERDQKKRAQERAAAVKQEMEKVEKKRKTDPCVYCGNEPDMHVGFTCKHKSCARCLHDTVVKATKDKKNLPVKCGKCRVELPPKDLQQALYPHEFEAYNHVLLQALIKSDEKMINCINEGCKNVIEMIFEDNLRPPAEIKEVDSLGNALSKEAWVHYKKYRLRCKECSSIFCGSCKTSPYHMGHTCEGWIEYKNSKHCRFCSVQITNANMHKLPSSQQISSMSTTDLTTFLMAHGRTRASIRQLREKYRLIAEAKSVHALFSGVFGDICDGEECQEKRSIACQSRLPCGCPCGGVVGEKSHLPCLKHTPQLDPDEFCPICYVECLKDAPSIQSQGACKHIFHKKCVTDRINAGYSGARINFKFITCPLCNNEISHPMLKKDMSKWQHLRKKIETKALERLKYEKRTTDPKIMSSYNGDPVAFAMHEYLFYSCFKCKQPYFAGNYACQAADDGKFDPAELLCAGCQPSKNINNCSTHGTEWIAFKCRFCCNTAQWFCWNKTHFCGKCHKPRVWQSLVSFRKGTNKKKIWEYPQCSGLTAQINKIKNDHSLTEENKMEALEQLRSDPRSCPLKRRHPPNGFEFGLGCIMCAGDEGDANKKDAAEGKEKKIPEVADVSNSIEA
eukprot:CAMPEP_0184494926 /NCGR_PEP_ID=MMETSP0113_2-20130426/29957_1 /TAXON_ID=91329 /ORGANISM="Norrisiella sphaerica, Strain BC52" /LENGTH=740 /DNA_ID=CAMNT_0026880887 /DNA_START=217 /DNA_END=2440 /DNA_ORIENTATION=-